MGGDAGLLTSLSSLTVYEKGLKISSKKVHKKVDGAVGTSSRPPPREPEGAGAYESKEPEPEDAETTEPEESDDDTPPNPTMDPVKIAKRLTQSL